MKIAIMQPYFLPYLGYIGLIKHTDEFILLDDVQFIHHGWIERNRILKPNSGEQYISVPLIKHSQKTLIKDIKIRNEEMWKAKIKAQLVHYKKKAPFYNETMNVIDKILKYDTDSIVKLNKYSLEKICEYLNINANIKIFSEMDLKIKEPLSPDEWALNICTALGNVDEYWNPPGGITFFDITKYEKANIKIKFLEIVLEYYSQRRGKENFIPGLSIIDVMMFNSIEEINNMLDNYQFIEKQDKQLVKVKKK